MKHDSDDIEKCSVCAPIIEDMRATCARLFGVELGGGYSKTGLWAAPEFQGVLAEGRSGCCQFCDAPLTGTKKVSCGAAECTRLYHRVYSAARPRKERRKQCAS